MRALYAVTDLEAFERHVTAGLHGLVPADVTAYVEIDGQRRLKKVLANPPSVFDFPDSEQILRAHVHESPLLTGYQRGEGSAVKISDFLTRRQFERLALYNEFFRRSGAVYQIAKGLPGPVGAVTALTLQRSRRDFTESDRRILNLLRPHLNQAYHNAVAFSALRGELEALRRGVEKLEHGVIVITRQRRVALMTFRARVLMAEYFAPRRGADRLPEPLERWITSEQGALDSPDVIGTSRRPFLVERQGKRLVVRLLPDRDQSLVLLDERRDRSVTAESLAPLNLSRREAEVLAWVAEGKTNPEIGVILGTSPRTIDKHLEHIYGKLNVESRTAAAARALAVAAGTTAT